MGDVVCGAVLFECAEQERIRVECTLDAEDVLVISQVSEGDLTKWCFEESPHRIEATVSREGVRLLLEHFRLEEACQLPCVLRMEYTGFDCFQQIRSLMRDLGVDYEVRENVIVR